MFMAVLTCMSDFDDYFFFSTVLTQPTLALSTQATPEQDRLLHAFHRVFHTHGRCPIPEQDRLLHAFHGVFHTHMSHPLDKTDLCTHSVRYSTPITNVPPQDRQTSAHIQWGIPLPSQMSHPRTDRLLHAFHGVFHTPSIDKAPGTGGMFNQCVDEVLETGVYV